MRVYTSIPVDIKPHVGYAKLHYVDAFENDFALLLRERKSTTLLDMFKDTLEVETNLMASGKMKQRVETYKRKFRDAMLEVMMRNMEILMEKLALDNRPQNMDQPE